MSLDVSLNQVPDNIATPCVIVSIDDSLVEDNKCDLRVACVICNLIKCVKSLNIILIVLFYFKKNYCANFQKKNSYFIPYNYKLLEYVFRDFNG